MPDAILTESRAATVPREIHDCHVFLAFDPGGAQLDTATVLKGLPARFRHTIVSIQEQETRCCERLAAGVRPKLRALGAAKSGRLRALRMGAYLRAIGADLLVTYNWGTMGAAIDACW